MISENKRNGSGYYDPTAYMAMMNVRKEGENKMEVYRGDIFYVKSNRKDTMKETTGSPAVVVSNDKGNENSNFVEIVYLTADERNLIPTHVNVMCKVPSVALCERISNVSKDRLEEYIRSCTDDEMRRIDEALMLSLGVEVSGGNTTEEAKETINALKLELVETKKIGEELKHKLKEEADKREAMETAMNTYEKNENFGTSSGIAMKYKLQGMSNLAKTKERKFTSGMNRRYKLIFSNPVSGMKEDDWVKLHYHFTPNIPSNVLEESQIAGNLDGIVSQETQLGVLSVVDNVQGEIDRIQQEENQKAEYMVLGRNENSILEMITIIKEYAERNGEEPVDVFNKILGEGVNGNEE